MKLVLVIALAACGRDPARAPAQPLYELGFDVSTESIFVSYDASVQVLWRDTK